MSVTGLVYVSAADIEDPFMILRWRIAQYGNVVHKKGAAIQAAPDRRWQARSEFRFEPDILQLQDVAGH
ncbi:hypothetical protein [Sphingomonas sp. Leaf62]|uniref:hypothetical protein n=1 Tax=Sphingomonas sp. Leaf62 TaxID=1736228 RepID=UPI001F42DA88|nr:hypothetical protein [Sphingomonas sp. Leaf62]